ncbi:MAG: hypothetical protein WDA10_14555, partial [Porticoccaceae bacterium]
MEQCDIQALRLRQPGLEAQLGVGAARRLQPKVRAAAIGRVGDLGQRRRLEPLADVGIQIGVGAQVPRQPDDRVGGGKPRAPAVVGVAGADVAVHHAEAHPVGPQPGHHAPVFIDGPVGLGIHPGAVDAVVLVALELALLPQVVDEALAVLAHALHVQAHAQAHLPLAGRQAARVAQARAVVAAVELHDAARRRRRGLRHQRNGQAVVEVALSGIDTRRDVAVPVQPVLGQQAHLRL